MHGMEETIDIYPMWKKLTGVVLQRLPDDCFTTKGSKVFLPVRHLPHPQFLPPGARRLLGSLIQEDKDEGIGRGWQCNIQSAQSISQVFQIPT